jgi:hypothetical protein
MPLADPAQRRLYRDLAALLNRLRMGPFANLDRAIEDRFRRFLKRGTRSPCDTLSVTFSWQLPEGADSWALYATEFRLEQRGYPADEPHQDDSPAPTAPGAAHSVDTAVNVVPFPVRRRKAARRTDRPRG